MSIFKTYLLDSKKARYAVQLEIGGRTRTISFISVGHGTTYSSGKPVFSTKDENVQKAIEGSQQFLDGKIKVVESKDAGDASAAFGSAPPPVNDSAQKAPLSNSILIVTFENVKSFAEAKAILTGEPYNLDKTGAVWSKAENILAKAKELGVNFPNLKADVTFENVKSFAEAKAILTGEPYNLDKTGAVWSKAENILAKAKELGVNFPNLKAE